MPNDNYRGTRIVGTLPAALVILLASAPWGSAQEPAVRSYRNQLTVLKDPQPILADYPEFVQPVIEDRRYEAPTLVEDHDADLDARAWRFSFNARGIIEMPNRLSANHTAVICVHPWGIDDSQGWISPEPAGVADMCTPAKNHLAARHTKEVIDPFLKRLRDKVGLVMYSLRGHELPVHAKLYRSMHKKPTEAEQADGRRELKEILGAFNYQGDDVPQELALSSESPVKDYFTQFPGLDAGAKYNGAGYWDLPIPVCDSITVFPNDIVVYDEEGYAAVRDFLKKHQIRHVLLVGYATDMCFCLTTAGYANLSKDFNVFLVGDATLATFPANITPQYATNAHISFASLNQLITQASWVQLDNADRSTVANSNAVRQPAAFRLRTSIKLPPVILEPTLPRDEQLFALDEHAFEDEGIVGKFIAAQHGRAYVAPPAFAKSSSFHTAENYTHPNLK